MKSYNGVQEISIHINGEVRTVTVRPRDTLLRTLRDELGLTGAKAGCENGDCGACTVLVDDVPRKSCVTLTMDVADSEITTIEGLQDTPLQRAFMEENGFQCGFCTPGQIMNGTALLHKHSDPSNEQIREYMESNLCRCTGYEGIERAIKRAASTTSRRPE